MRQLLWDATVALAMLSYRVARRLLTCPRDEAPPKPPPGRHDIPECPLAVFEEMFEVFEPDMCDPQAEWRYRWAAMRP